MFVTSYWSRFCVSQVGQFCPELCGSSKSPWSWTCLPDWPGHCCFWHLSLPDSPPPRDSSRHLALASQCPAFHICPPYAFELLQIRVTFIYVQLTLSSFFKPVCLSYLSTLRFRASSNLCTFDICPHYAFQLLQTRVTFIYVLLMLSSFFKPVRFSYPSTLCFRASSV